MSKKLKYSALSSSSVKKNDINEQVKKTVEQSSNGSNKKYIYI